MVTTRLIVQRYSAKNATKYQLISCMHKIDSVINERVNACGVYLALCNLVTYPHAIKLNCAAVV